jgi:ABC-type sugar transport system ATPase subunit
MGMVFQHFNLFANMNILKNMTIAPTQLLKKSKKEEDKISDSLNKPIIFAGILSGIVYGLRTITMPEAIINCVNRVYFVVIIFIVAWALLRMLSVMRLLLQEIAKKTENVYDDLLVSLI